MSTLYGQYKDGLLHVIKCGQFKIHNKRFLLKAITDDLIYRDIGIIIESSNPLASKIFEVVAAASDIEEKNCIPVGHHCVFMSASADVGDFSKEDKKDIMHILVNSEHVLFSWDPKETMKHKQVILAALST
jgi:hypothetical protein